MSTEHDQIALRGAGVTDTNRVRPVDLLFAIASGLALIAVWWVAVEIFDPPTYILPHPAAVFDELFLRRQLLLISFLATAKAAVLGLAISAVLGVFLGLVIARWEWVRAAVMPPLIATQSIPKVALAPVLVVALGFGIATKLVVVVLITFFPLVLGTVVGAQSVPRSTVLVAKSMGCRSLSYTRRIVLPTATPQLAAAFRLAASMSLIGALYAEFVGSSEGLGTVLLLAVGTADTVLAFATIIVVGVAGVIFYAGAVVIVRVATRGLGPLAS